MVQAIVAHAAPARHGQAAVLHVTSEQCQQLRGYVNWFGREFVIRQAMARGYDVRTIRHVAAQCKL
jgi:hypothetical protein